jgi:hypothetical protein
MSLYLCCEICGDPEPAWHIMRSGDAVITWACAPHLSAVCRGLIRPGELTELTVTVSRRLSPVARAAVMSSRWNDA